MKILVTGGAGFIGSNIVDALVEKNHDVHVLDDLSSGRREYVPSGVPFHEMDIRDQGVHDLFQGEGYDVLVHHAAQMDVRKSVADPSFDADVNVRGFLNLMEAGRAAGLRKVLFASTGGAIYGEPDAVPQDEQHALRPVSPYGITKLTTEKYLYYYYTQWGIPYVALRYGNIYGPRQNPHGDAGVVAIFCQQLLDEVKSTIFGDGEQTRDYVYVGDVVAANMAALDYERCGVFNVGTGSETSVNRLYRILASAAGNGAAPAHASQRPGEQRRSVLDNRLAAAELGWRPQVTIEDGLGRTFDWFKAHHAATQDA